MDKETPKVWERYQPLFSLMSEHGLTLLEDEMNQIIRVVGEMDHWRDIDFAPKDGTFVFGFSKDDGKQIMKYYDSANTWASNCMPCKPTHFQYLPKPPQDDL